MSRHRSSQGHEGERRSRSERKATDPRDHGGWRTSRRSNKAGKKVRRAHKADVMRDRLADAADRTQRGVRTAAWLTAWTAGGIVALVLTLFLLVLAINGLVRWNAQRVARTENSSQARLEKAKDNLLLIGLDANDHASGFLVLRVNARDEAIYGIAVPDGAFIEVPGQGFERVGDSWDAGPDVSLDAMSNFFAVPFEWYATVDYEIYQTALKNQTMAGVMDQATDTNLSDDDAERFGEAFDSTPVSKVALVPMPVKPMSLGDQTYLEPQRAEIADLVKTWWGVDIGAEDSITRVILYNGAGVPGIAGLAAQQLIRAGYRVVDTKNADNFNYTETQVVVQNGSVDAADGVLEALQVGKVSQQPADQEIADIIIIIGKDYKPPTTP
ncbi:MAG: LytR C-terminal domain-containing protein [Coriobacteriia bacterium]